MKCELINNCGGPQKLVTKPPQSSWCQVRGSDARIWINKQKLGTSLRSKLQVRSSVGKNPKVVNSKLTIHFKNK